MKLNIIRDLRAMFGPARDQGSRPTCCAFASSDLHAACRPPWAELSCEYAHYCAVKRQGTSPHDAVRLNTMLTVIEHDGQPLESGWRYLSTIPANVSLWSPPKDVGMLLRGKGNAIIAGLNDVHAILDQGRPVLIVLTLSDGFYLGIDADGVIDNTDPLDPTRVHAVVAVGYGTKGKERMTLVRNSWGPGWAQAGYAWLSDNYLVPRVVTYATITKVP